MMSHLGEYDLSRLKDSRIQYMRNPPKFIPIAVIAVVIILVGVVVWSSVTVKAEEVESRGMITSDGSNPMTAEVSGMIIKIYFDEGDTVMKDEIIVSFDTSEIDSEISGYVKQKEYYDFRIEMYSKAIDSVDDSIPVQPFRYSGDEKEFYVLMHSFIENFNEAPDNATKNSLRYQMLSTLYSEKNSCTVQSDSLKNTLAKYDLNLEKYVIKAKNSGVIHFSTDVVSGMIIQSGTQIGSVISEGSDTRIEMYVSAYNRARIDVDQECRFTIDGLAQSEYGSVTGRISSISSDAIVNENAVMFKVIVEFDVKELSDKHDNPVNIINGMTTDVWTIYEKSTYMDYFLDKLGVKL